MAELLTVQCPKCKAKLKLKSPAAIGKSSPCPKCKHTFVVKPLAEAEEQVPVLSEADLAAEPAMPSAEQDWLKQYNSSALPPLASRAPLPKLTPVRKKPANWQKPALIAGGGLLGVVLLVGVIWLVVSSLSGPVVASRPPAAPVEPPKPPARQGLDLAYLPPGAELVVSLRLADCVKAPVLQALLANPEVQQRLNELRTNVGLGLEDVHSVTIGVAGVSQLAKQQAQTAPPVSGVALPLPDLRTLPMIVVLRTSAPLDQQRIIDYAVRLAGSRVGGVKSVSHQGKSYYQLEYRGAQGPQLSGVYFADDKTAVVGSERDVQSAIARGDTTEVRPDLDFVDINQHLLVATTGKDAASIRLPTGVSPTQASELQKSIGEWTTASSFGVTLTEALAFQVQLACADATGADKLKSQLDAALAAELAKRRESMAQTKQQLEQLAALGQAPPPELVEMFDLMEAIFSSVHSEKSGGTIVVRASAPASVGATLAKIPEAISGTFSQGPPASAAGPKSQGFEGRKGPRN